MARFDHIVSSGSVVAPYADPERAPGTNGPDDKGAPSRLNADPSHPHSHHTITVGVEVAVSAIVAGVTAETDANLGGELFVSHVVETPGGVVDPTTAAAGLTSVQKFTPLNAGHHLFVMRRDNGGGVAIHFEAAV